MLALAAALAFTAILALPGTVAAHADLVASSPSDRAVVVGEPHQLTLVFSERVTLALSSVTVIAPSGHRVDRTISAVAGSGGERIRVQLAREEPGHGTFVATWRATAADDGHTTSGAVTFSVGAPGGTARAAGGTGGTGGQNRLTDAVLDVAIWLGFAGLAGMVGFAAVRLYCLPESGGGGGGDADHSAGTHPGTVPGAGRAEEEADGQPVPVADAGADVGADAGTVTVSDAGAEGPAEEEAVPPSWARVRWPATAGWAVLLAGTLIQLLVYGPSTQGESLRSTFDRPLLSASLSTHTGHTLVARIMLLALIAAVGDGILRHRRAGGAAAVALTFLLSLTWSEISHAPSEPLVPLALVVTALHVTAMAVWVGGMAALAVLMARGVDPGLAVAARRFSRLALSAVVVLAATGFYQAYREVGSTDALTGTHYGKLLLAKVALFLLVLAIAAGTRTRVRRGKPPGAPGIRRSVLLELAGVTGVLIMTVLLISTAPPQVPHSAAPVPHTPPAPSASR
ncbi:MULTISPECIES: copper resistance CopC/CopD family protein [unclassified Streptomyces]|uniref:copper resistance CopC/CopD family protein n=1 Tax=unclassified Streptomyces TaxID=2593676 RepID=UPI002E2A5E22|nr:copper resistance protein CopC [Streptomyces sp. NBC_00223]